MLLALQFLLFTVAQAASNIDKVVWREFNSTSFSSYTGWTFNSQVTDAITSCGNFKNIFGGYKKFGPNLIVSKIFTWANTPHYASVVSFTFFKIDTWDNESVDFYIDNNKVGQVKAQLSDGDDDECGMAINDKSYSLLFIVNPHRSNSLELKFVSKLNEDSGNESWGFNNIMISLKECDSSCRACSGPQKDKCTTCYDNAAISSSGTCVCRENYYHSDQFPNINCAVEPCGACMRCDITCKTCSGPLSNNCLSCQANEIFSEKEFTCTSPGNSELIARELTLNEFSVSPDWEITPTIPISNMKTQCGSYMLLGGIKAFQGGTVLKRTFSNLPAHFAARIKLMLLKIDKWVGNTLNINVDGAIINKETFKETDDGIYTYNQCGDTAYNEAERSYILTFDHSLRDLVLEMKTDLSELYMVGFWGIANFELVVYKCSDSCSSCTNNMDNCINCYEGYFLTKSQCVKICPAPSVGVVDTMTCLLACPNPNEFIDETDRICKPCNSFCKTCSGNANSCTSCAIPSFLHIGSCIEKCLDQFYEDLTGRLCKPCSSPCFTCTGDSITCLSCIESKYLLNKACVGSCPSDYFLDLNKKVCTVCSSPCLTCQAPGSSCLSCSEPLFLSDNTCKVKCPSGFWEDHTDRKCKACTSPCKSCTTTSSLCMECVLSFFLLSEACLEKCPSGKWGDTTDYKCKDCVAPCKTCSENAGNICLTCSASYFLTANTCVTNCLDGTFAEKISQTCLPCVKECKTCSEEAGLCLSCSAPNFLNEQKCISTCPAGTYGDQTELKCKKCQEPCLKCQEIPTKCAACVKPLFLNGEICQVECPAGQFGFEDENRICKNCMPPCLTCIKSESLCSSCSEPNFLNNGVCQPSCDPITMWADNSDRRCKSLICIYPCQTCFGHPTFCKTCTDPYYLSEASCIFPCPKGMWGDSTDRVCKSCEGLCETCSESAKFCLSCKPGSYLSGSECLATCPEGKWGDSNILVCRGCNNDCRTCEDSKNCNSCSKPFFLDKKYCVSQCPDGTFGNEEKRECNACQPACQTCSALGKCLTCYSPKFLSGSECVLECKKGEYGDRRDLVCKTCLSSCKTCSSEPSLCLTCHDSSFILGKKCLDQCPNGMWGDSSDNSCKNCAPPCLTCSESATLCASCAEPYYLSNSKCESPCPDGFFGENTNRSCRNCDSNCLTCDEQAQHCNSCSLPYFLKNNFCTEDCGDGYFGDPSSRLCKSCSSNCKTCVESSSVCMSCAIGEYLFDNKCLKCNQRCLQCSKSAEHCSECSEGNLLFTKNNTCLEICPIGYWGEHSKGVCRNCSSDCLSCFDMNNCTSCYFPKLFLTNMCVDACPEGYWEDALEQICRKICDPPSFFFRGTKDCKIPCPEDFVGEEINRTCITDCQKLKGSYYADANRVCRPCKEGCASCLYFNDNCLSCKPSFLMIEGENKCMVSCPENFCEKGSKCVPCSKEVTRSSFNMILDNLVSDFKILKILSNKPFNLKNSLTLDDVFKVRIEYLSEKEYNITVKSISRQEVVIMVDIKISAKVVLIFEMTHLDDIVDDTGVRLENFNDNSVANQKRIEIKINLPVIFIIEFEVMKKIEKVAMSVEVSVPASFASSSLPAIFFQNFNFLWSLIDCIQIASFFLLINVDYPTNTKLFLQKLLVSHLELIPGFLKNLLNIKTRSDMGESNDHIYWYQRAPYRFHKLNYTVNLIDNAGPQVQYLVFLYIVLFIVRVGSKFSGRDSRMSKIFQAIEKLYCYNIFIILHNMFYLKLCLSAMVQLTNFSQKQAIFLICYFFSCFLVVYLLLFKAWLFKNIHHPDFWLGVEKHTTRYDILLCDVNFDSFISKNLFFFLLLHKFLICAILVCIQSFPIVQISLLGALEILMFLLYVFNKPFIIPALNLIKAINSFIFTVLYLMTLGFYLIYVDKFETACGKIDKDFENIYFILGWIFNSLVLVSMVNLFIFYIYQFKTLYVQNKEEIKRFFRNILRRFSQSRETMDTETSANFELSNPASFNKRMLN